MSYIHPSNIPEISFNPETNELSNGSSIKIKLAPWADVQQASEKLYKFHMEMLDNLDINS